MVGVLVVGLALAWREEQRRAAGHPRRAPRRARGLLADRRAGAVAVRSRVRQGESLPVPRARRSPCPPSVWPWTRCGSGGGSCGRRSSSCCSCPCPPTCAAFDNDSVFNGRYFDEEQRILTTVVRMPFARRGPLATCDPFPTSTSRGPSTIGFLLDAKRVGPAGPVDGSVDAGAGQRDEGPARRGTADATTRARRPAPRDDRRSSIRPEKGTTYVLTHPRPRRDDRRGRPADVEAAHLPYPWTATSSPSSCPDLALRVDALPRPDRLRTV